MLGFGKSRKGKTKTDPATLVDSAVSEQIHVMPDRFYIKPAKKRFSFTLVTGLGVAVIIALAAAAAYFVLAPGGPSQELSPVEPEVVEQVKEELELPSDPGITATSTQVETEIATTTTPTSTSQATQPGFGEAQELAVDQDGDGLSLAEEQLYTSDAQLSDTDLDNYPDGLEVRAGYDPTVAGQTLEQTGVFRKYSNPFYSVNYPTGWELRDQSPGNVEVLFLPGSGEFIEVLILQNLNNLSLDEWFAQQFPSFNLSEVTRVELNGTAGIMHPSGLTYYLLNPAKPNSLYILTYNLGGLPDSRYLATFHGMVNSFKLTP